MKSNFVLNLKVLDVQIDEDLDSCNAVKAEKEESSLENQNHEVVINEEVTETRIKPKKVALKKSQEHENNLRGIKVLHNDVQFDETSCKYCFYKSESAKERSIHEESHKFELKPFHCPSCSIVFLKVGCLRDHYIRLHKQPRSFSCNYEGCELAFNSKARLTIHLQKHENPFAYECMECHKRFSEEISLKTHIKTIHLYTNFEMECEICGKK